MEHRAAYSLEQSKEGFPTLAAVDSSGKKVYLHSRFHPTKDAESLRDRFDPGRFDTLIVLGAGLGYHLAPLGDIYKHYAWIFIIDIFKSIESEIGKIPPVEFLIRSENITFLTGRSPGELGDILSGALDIDAMKGIQVLEHIPSVRAFPEYYRQIKNIISDIINRQAGNRATKNTFAMRYLRNSMINLENIRDCRPASSFFNSMTGFPALVLTSGPSLETVLEPLHKNRDRVFIIAVDSALPVLTRASITPDFLVSIDPQPHIYEHFIHGDITGTVPVYTLSSHPLPVKNHPGLLSLNSHPLAQMLGELYPGLSGSVDSLTGTVAGDALCLAHRFGFDAIGIAGFDFSFPRFCIYSRGSAYQHRFSRYFQSRITPVETLNLRYIMKSSRGFRYQNLFSRRSFIQYKSMMKSLVVKLEMPSIFNVSSPGIPLSGVPLMDINDFMSKNCGNSIPKKEIISKLLTSSEKIGEMISLEEIYSLLKNEELRRRLISASLEADPGGPAFQKAENYLLDYMAILNKN